MNDSLDEEDNYSQSSDEFIAALERRVHREKHMLGPVSDPFAGAREFIIYEWGWPDGFIVWLLLRALAGWEEEFFADDEESLSVEGLSIAAALVAAKRARIYSEQQWCGALRRVENLIAELEKTAWYSGSDPASKYGMWPSGR